MRATCEPGTTGTGEDLPNKHIADMDMLEDALVQRCRALRAAPETIFGHTLFDWWAHAADVERVAA